jgi:predicted nucleic acid-binding protein
MTILLADTSIWNRLRHPDLVERWAAEVTADNVGVTPVVRMEVLFSARSLSDYMAIDEALDGVAQVACPEAACERALDVQRALARKGGGLHHRSVGFPDLLIAAAAEVAGATVWHYDEDFDRIAEVTGQPTEWIVPRGSI